MATVARFEQSTKARRQRYFSEGFRKQKVRDIERNLCSVGDVCKEYDVSRTSVYRWLARYSVDRQKGVRQVIELKSDTRKLHALRKRLEELERVIGQKQLLIDYQTQVIGLVEQGYGIKVSKPFEEPPGILDIGTGGEGNKKER